MSVCEAVGSASGVSILVSRNQFWCNMSVGLVLSAWSTCQDAMSGQLEAEGQVREIRSGKLRKSVSFKTLWFSGRILTCHAEGPVPIPGQSTNVRTSEMMVHTDFI